MSAVPKKPAVVAKVTTPTDREIRTERVFDAPRERVWRAFTDPKLVAQWWGRATSSSSSGWKPNVDGAGRYVEHSPDGLHGFEGRFREVTAPVRLVQTFEWEGMPGHVAVVRPRASRILAGGGPGSSPRCCSTRRRSATAC